MSSARMSSTALLRMTVSMNGVTIARGVMGIPATAVRDIPISGFALPQQSASTEGFPSSALRYIGRTPFPPPVSAAMNDVTSLPI